MSRIDTVTAGYYRIPLPVVLTDSMHGEMTTFELVTVGCATPTGQKVPATPTRWAATVPRSTPRSSATWPTSWSAPMPT